jgi:hypothetical protein
MDIYPYERHGDLGTFVQQNGMRQSSTEVVNNRVASIEIFRLERMEDYHKVKTSPRKTVFLYEKCDIHEDSSKFETRTQQQRTYRHSGGRTKDQRVEMSSSDVSTQKSVWRRHGLATIRTGGPMANNSERRRTSQCQENIGDQLDMADDASTSGNLKRGYRHQE